MVAEYALVRIGQLGRYLETRRAVLPLKIATTRNMERSAQESAPSPSFTLIGLKICEHNVPGGHEQDRTGVLLQRGRDGGHSDSLGSLGGNHGQAPHLVEHGDI